MKIKTTCIWLYILLVTLASCKKERPLSDSKSLLSFKIEKAYNHKLTEDIIADIVEQDIVIQIPEEVGPDQLIATFTHNGKNVLVNEVIQQSGVSENNFFNELTYVVEAANGSTTTYLVKANITSAPQADVVPHIYITIAGNAEIVSKDKYLDATIKIDGQGIFPDYEGTTRIKGRGNSTWYQPKKPYRIKLDDKASLLGLAEEKDWVLLANYLDETLMLNAVAMKIGKQLDMPYTNSIIPVDLSINGTYRGSYMFTEQVEVSKTRINIEDGGEHLELDVNYDEPPYQFKSDRLKLPVMIKYPELEDLEKKEAEATFEKMKSDFNAFEHTIFLSDFPSSNPSVIDITSVADYLIVNLLTANGEIGHPKSVKMYRPKNEPYYMGPIWDFDWAFSYDGQSTHFHSFNEKTISLSDQSFFGRLLANEQTKALFKSRWAVYKRDRLPLLLSYIDSYADIIEESWEKDRIRWGKSDRPDFRQLIDKLKNWIKGRAQYMDRFAADL